MLGFGRVYDYVAGKEDWLAAMLPTEGRRELCLRASDALRRDVPTCRPDERIASTRDRFAGVGRCIVTTEDGAVLGALSRRDLDTPDDATAESRMSPGTTTVRPSEWLAPLVERMQAANVSRVLVTDPEGRLLGEVRRDAAESARRAAHAAHTGAEGNSGHGDANSPQTAPASTPD